MESPDWTDVLREHSTERQCAAGDLIIQAGQPGDSVYLVGSGSVDVVLQGPEEQQITVATLRPGDFFGEMAFFEHKPRNATVRAREACTVLEVAGPEFAAVLRQHPEIESKMLVKMSERLRAIDAEILGITVRNVDDKLKRVEERFDNERKVVEAHLRASETVFEQTTRRAGEIINAVERAERLTKGIGALATLIITLLGVGLAYLGYQEVLNIRKLSEGAKEDAGKASAARDTVERGAKRVEEVDKTLAKAMGDAERLRQGLASLERYFFKLFIQSLATGNHVEVDAAYRRLITIDPEQRPLALAALEDDIVGKIRRRDFEKPAINFGPFLNGLLRNARDSGDDDYRVRVQCLLLANEIAVRSSAFEAALEEFKRDVTDYRTRKMTWPRNVLENLRTAFDGYPNDVKQRFERFASLVPRS